jgi:hypothetical protein
MLSSLEREAEDNSRQEWTSVKAPPGCGIRVQSPQGLLPVLGKPRVSIASKNLAHGSDWWAMRASTEGPHSPEVEMVAIRQGRPRSVIQYARGGVAGARPKLPFMTLSSILRRKQKLLAGRRAVHQIKSWRSANNLQLAPCAADGDAIASRFRPVHFVT